MNYTLDSKHHLQMSSLSPIAEAETSTPSVPLLELSNRIAVSARTIATFLHRNNHPQPSFETKAPESTLPEDAAAEIALARRELMETALRMYHLATGPKEFLASTMAVSCHVQAALRWLTHFNIFSLVPLDGSAPYSTISKLANVPESYLKRVARLVMTQYLFCEPTPGHIAHTTTSRLLASGSDLHDWATFMGEMQAITANHLVEATELWGESVAKNETAYNAAFGTDLPFFTHLAQPDMAHLNKLFAGYMRCVTKSEGTNIKHLLNGFDWGSLPTRTRVIDVGGSIGHASIALAKAHSHLQFIVQDTPSVVDSARETLAELALPDSVASRISYQAHDFFLPQPQQQDEPPKTVYLLRMIIHDWPAAEATRILANLIPSLERDPQACIVVMDTVLPNPGTVSPPWEAVLRVRDLTMLQVFNSREREVGDWEKLVSGVDQRLQIKRAVQPVGSVMTVMELGFVNPEDRTESPWILFNGVGGAH